MDITRIVTGERLQAIADVYFGESPSDFQFNPWIYAQSAKHKYFSDLDGGGHPYENPRIVFCYGYLIKRLAAVIGQFANPFVLITHNCDENMVPNKPEIDTILNCPNLIRWYSQNVGLIHEKLYFLPIGIANRQWPHGNLEVFRDLFRMNLAHVKTKRVYMNFAIDTNREVRGECYRALADKIPFLPTTDFQNHLFRLAEYQFCICPIGNGLDTHRLWECFYLRVVPITLKNVYSLNIQRTTGLPMVLLDSWSDLFATNTQYDIMYTLPEYATFDFERGRQFLDIKYYMREITNL